MLLNVVTLTPKNFKNSKNSKLETNYSLAYVVVKSLALFVIINFITNPR
jgi:hypothetical protein